MHMFLGKKYSTCYVTLESGETFTGNVVWSDVNIDLSILKISCKNMKYAVLGDSDNIRVGEKSICNRKSNWI